MKNENASEPIWFRGVAISMELTVRKAMDLLMLHSLKIGYSETLDKTIPRLSYHL